MVPALYDRIRSRFKHGRRQTTDESRIPTEASASPSHTVMRHRKIDMPLAIGLLEHHGGIDPQLLSPFFTKLPRELREMIWHFALTRYEDFREPFDFNKRCSRPGQAARLRIAVELLLTCRAIYVETYLTPFHLNPIVVFDGDQRDVPYGNPLLRLDKRQLLCEKLRNWQFANISSVEMTVQQYTLEGGSLERVSRLIGTLGRHQGHESRGFSIPGYALFAQPAGSKGNAGGSSGTQDTNNNEIITQPSPLIGRKITHLTIRMNRTDWWTWSTDPEICQEDPSERLRLEPMIHTTASNGLSMTQGYEARKTGQEPDFELDEFEKGGRWGPQITEFWPDLTRLELALETFNCKRSQLDDVVKCAKLWTFPLGDGYRLVWNGKEEEAYKWRGASSYEYEYDSPWASEENRSSSTVITDPATRWNANGDWHPDGQEFVIRTVVFERQRI
ncbi:hypothetical protein AAE478_003193 [Parahypoxylon ruwenzoriense]